MSYASKLNLAYDRLNGRKAKEKQHKIIDALFYVNIIKENLGILWYKICWPFYRLVFNKQSLNKMHILQDIDEKLSFCPNFSKSMSWIS